MMPTPNDSSGSVAKPSTSPRHPMNIEEKDMTSPTRGPEWMADYFAIADLKARYCRLLDSKDWAGFANLFTADLELDVSDGTDQPIIRGRDEAMAMVRGAIETARTAHQVHSPEIEIDGDAARAIWAMQDRVVWAEGHSLTGYGHYHERYVRRADGWKIANQKLTRLHIDFTQPVSGDGESA